jgi:hypothetical protein
MGKFYDWIFKIKSIFIVFQVLPISICTDFASIYDLPAN